MLLGAVVRNGEGEMNGIGKTWVGLVDSIWIGGTAGIPFQTGGRHGGEWHPHPGVYELC